MELSIRVQKKQKTVFVISFFSFFCFFSAVRQLFLKNLFVTSEIFVAKKNDKSGEKTFFPIILLLSLQLLSLQLRKQQKIFKVVSTDKNNKNID